MLGHGALGEYALGETESDGGTILLPSAIASAEAIGTPTLLSDGYAILPSSIASAEAFGDAELSEDRIFPSSIASAEAFGTPAIILVIAPSSIASAESVPSQRVAEHKTYLPVSRLN